MKYDRNPKEAVDDPEPIVDRDPTTGEVDQTDPRFREWLIWNLGRKLTQAEIDGLREQLEELEAVSVLKKLDKMCDANCEVIRLDYQCLLNEAVRKYGSPSNLKVLTW